MRLSSPSIALGLLAVTALASAAPVTPTSSSFNWQNGQSKTFEVMWNGSNPVFTVQDVATASFATFSGCCDDIFGRVKDMHPGASLVFSGLVLNTMPIDTVFEDDLDLSLFKLAGTDNINTLTGMITLHWGDYYSPFTTSSFVALPEGDSLDRSENLTPPSEVPEPATLMLVGSGLLAAAAAARRRKAH